MHGRKIESLLSKLVKEGVLFKGKWRAINRVGFSMLSYMMDVHIERGMAEGVYSWDTYLSRQLSIVLVVAFAARSGEVIRSRLYTSMECLQYKDLTIEFCSLGVDFNAKG